MNRRDITNVDTISVGGNILVSNGLVIGNEHENEAIRFTPGALSSAGNLNVVSPNFTISSPDSADTVSISKGHLHAKNLTVASLSSENPVRFHKTAIVGRICTGSQISFTTNGEPAYCKDNKWLPFVDKTTKNEREEKISVPGIKPPHGRRKDPVFNNGTAKWVSHSAVLTFPPTYRDDRFVFFIGSEWTYCEVVNTAYPARRDTHEIDRIAGLLRRKFTAHAKSDTDEISCLGKEATWQLIVLRPAPISHRSHTYKVTCHRPAFLDSDNNWHMATLPPIAYPYSFDHAPHYQYTHDEFQRIELLSLTRDPGQ
jgi:hypothetical protein